jgi:hypothetical protein
MSEQEMIAGIKTRWGALLNSAAKTSSVPESFLAALVANESGGNADGKRFEPAVFAALAEVLLGRKAAYGSLGGLDVRRFVLPAEISAAARSNSGLQVQPAPVIDAAECIGVFQRLESLATSWGLVQIMGYEAIAFRLDGISALQSPASELPVTLRMLQQFAERNGLDLAKDFSEMFDCWNTGRPHARTFDPNYIPNGLARMKAYEDLP